MDTGVIEVPGKPTRFYLTPLSAQQVFERGLRIEAIIGELPAGAAKLEPENLRENEVFAKFVCWVITKHGPASQELLNEASRIGTGSVRVVDLRVGDTTGSVAAEDIFGTFEVKEGKLIRFHGNPEHKALTRRGFMKLNSFFEFKLLEELRALPAVETGRATHAAGTAKPWWKFW